MLYNVMTMKRDLGNFDDFAIQLTNSPVCVYGVMIVVVLFSPPPTADRLTDLWSKRLAAP